VIPPLSYAKTLMIWPAGRSGICFRRGERRGIRPLHDCIIKGLDGSDAL